MGKQAKITKDSFRVDMKYIREVMRQVEKNLTENNWQDIYTCCQEIAATAAGMEYNAQDKCQEVK
jgi:hypothetical protein